VATLELAGELEAGEHLLVLGVALPPDDHVRAPAAALAFAGVPVSAIDARDARLL
jgi:hypothetical protein